MKSSLLLVLCKRKELLEASIFLFLKIHPPQQSAFPNGHFRFWDKLNLIQTFTNAKMITNISMQVEHQELKVPDSCCKTVNLNVFSSFSFCNLFGAIFKVSKDCGWRDHPSNIHYTGCIHRSAISKVVLKKIFFKAILSP